MWTETSEGLFKEFTFADFKHAFAFMQEVAVRAEELHHHPKWTNEWNIVSIWLYTHDKDAITDKDRALAQAIDAIYLSNENTQT